MAHSRTYEAIMLRTYDVGEADRFCVLLTRERGRLAARARGVRKLTSRIGGGLLPLCRTKVDLHEGGTGFVITGVHSMRSAVPHTIDEFLQAEQGIELLMQLLEDDDPSPELFDLTEEFLEECTRETPSMLLPFTVRLLFLLGLLPHIPRKALAEEEMEQITAYIKVCTTREWRRLPTISGRSTRCLQSACNGIIAQHARSELRAAAVAGAITNTGSSA